MNGPVQTVLFKRGRLPHWLVAGHAYFVTLCRKGCLPAKVVKELEAERAERAAEMLPSGLSVRTVTREGFECASQSDGPSQTSGDVRLYSPPTAEALGAQRCRFLQLDAILDAAARSERDLCEPNASEIILTNLDWLRGRGWRIWAATLMPSHAHLVLSSSRDHVGDLISDFSSFMAYTARLINRTRGISGGFWQREPFDHWCRDGDAWLRSVSYTLNNPVKASLCSSWREWPHTVADPEVDQLLS